jgi:hypothetical protein
MSGEGARGASPPSGRTLQGLGEIRELATDALRYWELRRLFYNLLRGSSTGTVPAESAPPILLEVFHAA